jgi:hypothetical protein
MCRVVRGIRGDLPLLGQSRMFRSATPAPGGLNRKQPKRDRKAAFGPADVEIRSMFCEGNAGMLVQCAISNGKSA